MKFLFVLLWMIGATLVSCSDSKNSGEPEPDGPLNPDLKVDRTELLFQKEEATSQLVITSNVKWTATSSVSWCELSKMSGSGNDTLKIKIAENLTTGRRNGEVYVNGGGAFKIKIPVVQLGADVETLMFVDGVEITGGKVLFDFESSVYSLRIMSNVENDYELLKTVPWFQYRVANADPKEWVFSLNFDDNRKEEGGLQREVAFKFAQREGTHVDTVHLIQRAYSDFVRFFSDTVYAGSNFSCLEILARTTIAWNYEFVGGQPSWIKNPVVENAYNTQKLGKNSRLMVDMETNTSNQKRKCELKFTYQVGGKSESQVISVVQLPYNPTASDSLVLMKLAEKNSVELVGLAVDNWSFGVPFVSWGDGTSLVFEEVDGYKRLKELRLRGAYLSYELTPDIANLGELKALDLERNFLIGSLPKEIGRMKKLEELTVSENNGTPLETPSGESSGVEMLPNEICEGCTELKILGLAVNRFKSIPEGIFMMKKLEKLNMGMNNLLTNVSNESLKGCKSLKDVDLSRIPYNGPFFDFIFECPNLERVNFNYVPFSQNRKLEDKFDRLPNLRVLEIDSANLTETLPLSLVSCKNLSTLSLASNDMTGVLPTEFSQLDKLEILNLSYNDFTGSIPESWVVIGNVGVRVRDGISNVFLNGNRLGGVIPEAIKNMTVWTDNIVRVPVDWDNSIHFIGRWIPTEFICPQQPGYGFSNCDVK